ncbi:Dihydrolipoyllysine-residue succinyltransferase component of 2-oxoglutarate dehydrogenase, partial [Globisporangium splendens]
MWGSLRATTQQLTKRGAAAKTLQQRFFAITTVNVPSMGDSISEGTLVQIVKGVGETVHADEVVAILETDKRLNSGSGTIVEHLAKLEENVEVGRALFSVDDSRAPEPGSKAAPSKAAATPAPAAPVVVAAAVPVAASSHRVPSIKFLGKRSLLPAQPSPLTKPAARQAPSPLAPVQPSGPNVLPFNHVKRAPLTPTEVDAINSGIAFLRRRHISLFQKTNLTSSCRLDAHHRRRAEDVVLRARAAADRPLAAIRNAALLAATVCLAVAASAVGLRAPLGLAATAASVADAFATAVGLALAAWHITGLRTAVGFAQSAMLAQTLTSLHRTARLAAMRTAPSKANLRTSIFIINDIL